MHHWNRINRKVESHINELCQMIEGDGSIEKIEFTIKVLRVEGGINYIDAGFYRGNTLLNYALQKEREDVATILLREGADPAIQNTQGVDALSIALKTYKRLPKTPPTIQSLAREYAYWKLIEKIIESNPATLEACSFHALKGAPKSTPLHLVASIKFFDLFLFLVSKKLVNLRNIGTRPQVEFRDLNALFGKGDSKVLTKEEIQEMAENQKQEMSKMQNASTLEEPVMPTLRP